jgi:hypothetical protein
MVWNLVVLPSQVGQATDGWDLADRGVAVMVVLVDPCGHGFAAGAFEAVEAFERPAVGQGAVEAFNLPVGLGRYGRVRLCLMRSSTQVSRHRTSRVPRRIRLRDDQKRW